MGHLTAISPLIQLLLGFKEPERCSSGKPKKSLGVDKYSWTSVTAILSWKICPAFSVKQPLPECLNCTKWWIDQIMFLTLPRNCRAAGQCQGQCFQGAYCMQLMATSCSVCSSWALSAQCSDSSSTANWWNSVRGMCRSGQASALPLICWPAFLSAKLIC